MVTLRVFQRQQVEALTDLDQISELLMQPRTLIWLDLEQPTATEVALLHNEFDFIHLPSKMQSRPTNDRKLRPILATI